MHSPGCWRPPPEGGRVPQALRPGLGCLLGLPGVGEAKAQAGLWQPPGQKRLSGQRKVTAQMKMGR